MDFEALSEKEEELAKKIVDAAYAVHKRLGFLINFNVTLIKDGIKRMIL